LYSLARFRYQFSVSFSLKIHSADLDAIIQGQPWNLPVPVQKASVRSQGLRPREAKMHLAVSVHPVLSSDRFDIVDASNFELSRLNTSPARSPVNASLTTLQLQPHDSGPIWVANPSSYGTLIHYFLPVLTGAPNLSIFCYTNKMIHQYRYVKAFMNQVSHEPIRNPKLPSSQAAR
jgi:hypothetical protein